MFIAWPLSVYARDIRNKAEPLPEIVKWDLDRRRPSTAPPLTPSGAGMAGAGAQQVPPTGPPPGYHGPAPAAPQGPPPEYQGQAPAAPQGPPPGYQGQAPAAPQGPPPGYQGQAPAQQPVKGYEKPMVPPPAHPPGQKPPRFPRMAGRNSSRMRPATAYCIVLVSRMCSTFTACLP
jgi:hypothetical protein